MLRRVQERKHHTWRAALRALIKITGGYDMSAGQDMMVRLIILAADFSNPIAVIIVPAFEHCADKRFLTSEAILDPPIRNTHIRCNCRNGKASGAPLQSNSLGCVENAVCIDRFVPPQLAAPENVFYFFYVIQNGKASEYG